MDNDDIVKASTNIDNISVIVAKNIDECCLLIVKVGSDKIPATKEETQAVKEKLFNMLRDVPGLKLVVSNMDLDVQKITLPKLRQLQSTIVNSANGTDSPDEKKSHPLLETIELP